MIIVLNGNGLNGLVGTLGYAIYAPDDSVIQARTTDGIEEFPAGSGNYKAVVADALLAGNLVVWDTGGVSPLYATESFPTDLDGYHPDASFTRSPRFLANRAHLLCPETDAVLCRELALDVLADFWHRGGKVQERQADLVLPAYGRVTLPADLRKLKRSGVFLVLRSTNAVVSELSMIDAAYMRSDTWIATPENGQPTGYFFPDNVTLAVTPAPGSTLYGVRLVYDSDAPWDLPLDAPLPWPRQYERALMAGIIAAALEAITDKTDAIRERLSRETSKYEKGLTQWQGSHRDRQLQQWQAKPWYAHEED